MEPEGSYHYGFNCLAFLDILGQRRLLRQLPPLPTKDGETTKLIKETAGYVLRLRKQLADCFEAFGAPTPFLTVLPDDAQKRIINARRGVKYRGFSDSIIMSVSFRDDEEQVASIIGVYGCMAACCILHLVALSLKRPIRGGIDVGLGMDIADDEAYGPVLERAHYLEAEFADYPRILVGAELSHYLDEVQQQRSSSSFGRLAQSLASKCQRLITVDTDGFRMLDFLGEAMAGVGEQDQRPILFGMASDYIKEQKQIGLSRGDHKHLSRYFRLGAYLESRSKLWT